MDSEFIARIKNSTDMIALVGSFVALKPRGGSYWGLCPFHDEKSPSFHVDPSRQMYKCFGCGESGDAISFIMEMKGLSFMEAVEELAERAGIPIPEESRRAADRRGATKGLRKACFEANDLAARFFQGVLLSPHGAPAREYLHGRGVNEETIERFGIGYAPESWDALSRALKKRGVSEEIVVKSGLAIPRKNGRGCYDRFRNRLMFPIRDLSGEVIAFGGRVMGDGEPKYLNSPETPVFDKSRVLYHLGDCRREIREKGVAVVEGYMDVVSLAQAGFPGAVATLGTALGSEHVKLLRRFTESVTLVYDGDEAGRAAMRRALEPFSEADIIPRVVLLPAGKDPDDMARQNIDEWNSLLEKAPSIWDFIFDESFSGRDPSKLEDQNAVLHFLIPQLAAVKDPRIRDLLVERLAIRLDVRGEVIRRDMARNGNRQETGPRPAEAEKPRPRDRVEDTLARLMLLQEHAIRLVDILKLKEHLRQEDVRELVDFMLIHGSGVLEHPACPPTVRNTAAKLMTEGDMDGDEAKAAKALSETAAALMGRVIDRNIDQLQKELALAEKENNRERVFAVLQMKKARTQERKNVHNTIAEALKSI